MDLRIGIIGLGYWGKALLQYFRELPEVRIVALHSRNPQRASEVDLNGAVFYESQEEMFAKAKLDAVIVCNTPPEHLFSTRLAAERGIHVFCEKPMAASLADCEEMIAVCHKHQVKLMVAFKHRFARAFSYLRNDLEHFGKPLWAMYTYPLWKVEDSGWKFVEEGTKGIVVENMVHAIDAMRYLFGDVIRLYAEGDNFVFKNVTPPDSAIINLRFANGAIAAIGGGCTSDRRISREYLDIHFEHGLAQISGKLDQPYFLRILMRESTFPEEHTFEGSDGVREEIRHFVDCLRTGKEPIVNGMDGQKAVAIALAAIESIRSHKPVVF